MYVFVLSFLETVVDNYSKYKIFIARLLHHALIQAHATGKQADPTEITKPCIIIKSTYFSQLNTKNSDKPNLVA